jgi:30S ribosomal protein S31
MGKGDRRSKRGKVFRGTFGKKRPKAKPISKGKPAAAATTPG